MLFVRPIGEGQARYYLDGPGTGRWLGTGATALEVGFAGTETIQGSDLRALLAGRHPSERTAPRPAGRRAGFDLIFASPKSVSLLAALAPEPSAARLGHAHDSAVTDALAYLERRAALTRRGADHRRIPTSGLLAAAFTHHSSWSGDPHLHTHLVVANLVQGADGRWSSLDSRTLYRHATAAGAVFQASLRHHLAQAGLAFSWELRPNGLADVAGVPRAAIEACSQRGRQIAELTGRSQTTGERLVVALRTRSVPPQARSTPPPGGPEERWETRAARAGLDRSRAASLTAAAAARATGPPDPPTARAVADAIEAQHVRFHRADVVRVMACLTANGAPAATLERWADQFLAGALPLDHQTWTTPGLRRLEDRIVDLATRGPSRPSGLAHGGDVNAALGLRPDLSDTARDAVRRLTTGGAPVEVLAPGDFVTTAFVLEAARVAWESHGHRVAVLSQSERSGARWEALSGIGPPPAAPAHPTVVVVDRADRWSTTALHRVLADCRARNAKVVLALGGTGPAPHRPVSPALEVVAATLGGIQCGRPAQLASTPSAGMVRGGRDGTVLVGPSGPAAVAQLIDDWARARPHARAGSMPVTMVALGPEEAEYLNSAARRRLVGDGLLGGPVIEAGGRSFQAGDAVRALRRDPRLGSVPAGTVGVVTATDPSGQRVTIRWPSGSRQVAVSELRRAPLTHGYATTPAYLRRDKSAVLWCLGNAGSVAPGLNPHRVYHVACWTPDRIRHQPARIPPFDRVVDEVRWRRQLIPGPTETGRSLAELCAERDRLGRQLSAHLPSDPHRQLRDLADERAWLTAVPSRPDGAVRAAELDRRQATLSTAAARRAEWVEAHRHQLVRWDELDAAVAWRQQALGQAAALRPGRAVLSEVGPPPATTVAALDAWRDAAGRIEAYRERWAMPDEPLGLTPGGDGRDGPRRAEELGILAARLVARRAIGTDRHLTPPDG